MKTLRIYKCSACNDIVFTYQENELYVTCCEEPMTLIEANTVDAAAEKHMPVVTQFDNTIKVSIGSIMHPMTEEHHISFILLEEENGYQIKYLKSTDEPIVQFKTTSKVVAVYEYCTLHGLWKETL